MKLWQKNELQTDVLIEQFTVGRDPEFDLLLAKYDVKGSLAHVTMLEHVGLLTEAELTRIREGLQELLADISSGNFVMTAGVEDVHSQIEWLLTEKIGEAGKKIHSGRSRNDQVAVDIKLYLKDALQEIKGLCVELFRVLMALSGKHRERLLPGLTHLQIAMPSSFGLWFAAYAECLCEDLELLYAAYRLADKNPLGSGAGYGSSFPLDRSVTTSLLGFRSMHYNVINAQMSRGKTEKFAATALAAIGATVAKLAMDICLFMNQSFGFISFPDTLTTGSSIMPHKKNPDLFELTRAKCNMLQAVPNELALLMANLPSGYHRDLQLTKEILFPSIERLKSCLQVMCYALPQMEVRDNLLAEERYHAVFTVEAVAELVHKGVPFREAYKIVGRQVAGKEFHYPGFDISRHTHEGSMGNLCNDRICAEFEAVVRRFDCGESAS